MIVIKALSSFQENTQSSDQKPDVWNSFTKQTKQFLCTSNSQLKGPETKKPNKEQENRHNNYHVPAMKEQLTATQQEDKTFKKYDTHQLSPKQTLI